MAALSAAMAAMSTKVLSPLSGRVDVLSRDFASGLRISPSTGAQSVPLGYCVGEPVKVFAAKKLLGKVVRTVNDKTAAVEVTRIAPHPRYRKRVRLTKTFQVHDPENICQVGDVVQLAKCPPVSKTKSFVVTEIKQRKARIQIPRMPAASGVGEGAAA
ncbi:hypothetical protein CBR_g33913 [Chara braunii]|uniref:Small ribosomal subunit protein uS17c n=1 Tax=Chara braunii TaxID=69332 RepID=A0A388LHD1_CHABU|nr:hypothetical protein CBR_g33913 [Chara braunii]|eukprot:GBG81734.1 hypothetical protein CBR_g33913 [Chara braunii]